MPLLSIVIPSSRRPDLLERCLKSVTSFSPTDAEIIVVDDGSPQAVIAQTACHFERVRVLRLPERSGFCVAANVGLLSSSGRIVELLNDDTEVAAGWADVALARFENPNVVAVAPLVLQLDPERSLAGLPPLIDSAGDDYDYGGFARKRFHGRLLGAHQRELKSAQLVWGVSAAAAFYRREAVLQAGLFPTDFGAYFEDVDLSHRLRSRGEVWFDPESVVWHRVSASYGKHPAPDVVEQQSCNEERVFWRNVHGWKLLANLPRHAAVLCAKAMCRVVEGQFRPWLSGRWRAWTGC